MMLQFSNKQSTAKGWFVSVFVISIATLFYGCATVEGQKTINSAPETAWSDPGTSWMVEAGHYFIEPESYTKLVKLAGNFWGKKIDERQVILTIPQETKISRFENLINEYNVAISTANMPKDLEVYLKNYQHNEYGNYYNYLRTFVDTIILCPQYIDNTGLKCEAMSWPEDYDKLFYPEGGKLILLNIYYYYHYNPPTNHAAMLELLSTILHETAHKQWWHLINIGKIPANYSYNEAERYAVLTEVELLEKILQNPMSKKEEDYLKLRYNDCLERIRTFNAKMRLYTENRELFPKIRE